MSISLLQITKGGDFITKKCVFLTGAVLILFNLALLAHTPILLVEDNGDGTLYAEAGFSDGSSAQGSVCRLETPDGEVLWEGKFDEFSSVEMEIPNVEEYYVIFDAGPGHIVKKKGPALNSALKEGSGKTEKETAVDTKSVDSEQDPNKNQPAMQDTASLQNQPKSHTPAVSNYYPVRQYGSFDQVSNGIKDSLMFIAVFSGIIALCLVFLTMILLFMAVKK